MTVFFRKRRITQMFGTLVSLLSLSSRVGADHVQPWIFVDEPVAMISKAGMERQRNRLFFGSGKNCETDIIVWLSSENKKALETAEKQVVELKFDVLQDALSYTLTETILVKSLLGKDTNMLDKPFRVATLHIGTLQHANMLETWLEMGVTGFSVSAPNQLIFDNSGDRWDTYGLEGALSQLTHWCQINHSIREKV